MSVRLFALIAAVVAIALLIASLAVAAPPPAAQPKPEAEPETTGFVVVPVEEWEKVARALMYWYAEAQRLNKSKGCV